MKHRSIEIITYAGLPRRPAEALMQLDILLDGADAAVPETESVELLRLECLDDVQGLLATDPNQPGGSPLAQAFRQKRWIGTGVIANVQNATVLPEDVAGNAGMIVAFCTPDPAGASYVGKLLGASEDMAGLLQKLPQRHFLLRALGFDQVVHGITPTIHAGAPLAKEAVERHMQPVFDEIADQAELSPPYDDELPPISYGESDGNHHDATFSEPTASDSVLAEHISLLKVIIDANGRNISTWELYRLAGVSPEKGGRLKRDLIQNGLIRIEKVAGKGRSREVALATDAGRALAHEVR